MASGSMEGGKDMKLNKDWADKVIEEAEEMSGVERSTFVLKKMEELVELIELLDKMPKTEDVKSKIRLAEDLFAKLFNYVNA